MAPWKRARTAGWAAVSAAALAGCAHAGLRGTEYRDRDLAFRVGPIPPTWRPIEQDTARLAFRDDDAHATIAVSGRCGQDGDDVPLTSLTQHLFLDFTERSVLAQEELMLDGRAALRTEMVAKLDGVERRFMVFVLKKDGCVYDFLFIAEPGTGAAEFAAFERFVTGFATVD